MVKFISSIYVSIEMVFQVYSLASHGIFKKSFTNIFLRHFIHFLIFFSPGSNYVFVEAIQHALKNIFVSLHETCSLHTDDGPGIVALFLLFFSVSFLVHGFLLTMS